MAILSTELLVLESSGSWQRLMGQEELDLSELEGFQVLRGYQKEAALHFKSHTAKENLEVNVTATPLLSPHTGEVHAYLCQLRLPSVTLSLMRDPFFTLIDHFPFGIGVHRNAKLVYVNSAAARMLGYENQAELIHKSVLAIIAPEERAIVAERVSQISSSLGQLESRETTMLCKDGRYTKVELAAFTVQDEWGEALHVVVARDITQQKRLEEQLGHIQRMEVASRLAGGIVHDFSNFLAVIMSYAELIQQQSKEKSTSRSALEIQKAAKRSVNLTKELLTFAKGHYSAAVWQDPLKVLNSLSPSLRQALGPRFVLELKLPKSLPGVRMAPNHLERIFLNLIMNAKKAMPDGGKVHIGASERVFDVDKTLPSDIKAGLRYVVFEVVDEGIGMSDEMARRAVEPFYSTKPFQAGSGLGLTSVYGMVKQAGGHIDIVSSRGNGSNIQFYIPAAIKEGLNTKDMDEPQNKDIELAPSPGNEEEGLPSDIPEQTPTPLDGMRILLVEDDPSVRSLVSHLLRRHGADVIEADNAAHAYECLEKHVSGGYLGPDLLLTDVIMPDISGTDLAYSLQRVYPDLKVLFMSGYSASYVSPKEMHELGAYYIEKPFSNQMLITFITQMLSLR